MKCPLSSNLVCLIEEAINNCYYNGEANVKDDRGMSISAEWVDSTKRRGYTLIHLVIMENGVIKFSYDDYGTECKTE